jgi:hypothetical protein
VGLADENGNAVRHVAEAGDLNTPLRYRVTGPDYDATEHPSLAEAMAATEASLSTDGG